MSSFDKKLGFTLIETVVTMAILAMILGIVLSFQGSRRDQFNLIIYQDKVRALITRAKSLALNNTDRLANGYGVHIVAGKAFIYIDRNNDHVYTSNSNDSTPNTSIDFIDAREGISFKDISVSPPVDQTIDIVFEPPDPTVYLYKNGIQQIPSGSFASSIEIGIVVGKNYRRVMVNSVGQISILNK